MHTAGLGVIGQQLAQNLRVHALLSSEKLFAKALTVEACNVGAALEGLRRGPPV